MTVCPSPAFGSPAEAVAGRVGGAFALGDSPLEVVATAGVGNLGALLHAAGELGLAVRVPDPGPR